jgi:hypothetical protein
MLKDTIEGQGERTAFGNPPYWDNDAPEVRQAE